MYNLQKNNNQNQILIKKIEELYDFYLLKTVIWANKGFDAWYGGHKIQHFPILPDKRYEVITNRDIFLLVQSNEKLELCLQFRNGQETKQKNYQFTKHPYLNWWIGAVAEKDLELLLKEFSNEVSLSGKYGVEFKEVYSFYSIQK